MRARLRLLVVCLLVLLPLVGWRWYAVKHRRWHLARPSAVAEGPSAGRPNVLLISLDTVRPDHLGCYGYNRPTSPNLDAFARGALVYTQARAQVPWTVPSHMSLFTSMLPSATHFEGAPFPLAASIPTLPEVLQSAGYRTAAIVNNGGLHGDWGFGRGFDQYEEHEATQPDGAAQVISARAVKWLAAAGRQPWFLFLHYYDAHDPYRSPEPFYSHFGAVPPEVVEKAVFEHVRPGMEFEDPQAVKKLEDSYDASIAYLDSQLAKVLARVGPETLVVVFSDHGEAFKEHGWLFHDSTLYEEEIRCGLIVRRPAGAAGPATAGIAGRRIDDPVMLLDVAPTILGQCGVAAPATFTGVDLCSPGVQSGLSQRTVAAEIKAWRAGQLLKCLIQPPWKYIYDMANGREELYKLPDEHTDLMAREPAVAAQFRAEMRGWVEREKFWLIYFTGPGEFEGQLGAVNAQVSLAIPLNLDVSEQSNFEPPGPDNPLARWALRPGQRVQAIYVETRPPDAPLEARLEIGRHAELGRTFVGASGAHPTTMPSEFWIGAIGAAGEGERPRLSLGIQDMLSPFMDQAFRPKVPGFYVRRFGVISGSGVGQSGPPGAGQSRMVDPRAIEQLKAFGYMAGESARHPPTTPATATAPAPPAQGR